MFTKKIKIAGIFIIIFVIAGIISFNRNDEGTDYQNLSEKLETAEIDENDLVESDEDLLNVDYKDFYDQLAPHGEWIEVTDKEIGVDLEKGSASGERPERTISFSDFFGVKDAYADDVAFGAFFIWRPSPNLAISVVAGEPEPYYVPYAHGQWVYSDDGWYFLAPTPYEEIVHHYGRWVYSPSLGWVWIPGRVWAPAWVEWRFGFGYTAWAPVPPSVYIVNNYLYCPPIYEERYIIVENRYFCEPLVYNYRVHGHHYRIKNMDRVDGIYVRENRIFNAGPDITIIERDRGSKLDRFKVNRVKDFGDVKRSNNKINSYSPDFQRVKNRNSGNSSVFKPGKYEKYNDVKDKRSNENRDKQSSGDRSFSKNDKKSDSWIDSKGSDKQKKSRNDGGNTKKNKESGNYKSDRNQKDNGNKDTKKFSKERKSNDNSGKDTYKKGKDNFNKKDRSGNKQDKDNNKSGRNKERIDKGSNKQGKDNNKSGNNKDRIDKGNNKQGKDSYKPGKNNNSIDKGNIKRGKDNYQSGKNNYRSDKGNYDQGKDNNSGKNSSKQDRGKNYSQSKDNNSKNNNKKSESNNQRKGNRK